MSATFKCLATGNLVTFKYAVDIESMRIHPEYVEIEEPEYTETVIEVPAVKRGRPAKKNIVEDTDNA